MSNGFLRFVLMLPICPLRRNGEKGRFRNCGPLRIKFLVTQKGFGEECIKNISVSRPGFIFGGLILLKSFEVGINRQRLFFKVIMASKRNQQIVQSPSCFQAQGLILTKAENSFSNGLLRYSPITGQGIKVVK